MARRRVTDPNMLIEAAARLFQRKGYTNTTIDDLAQEVGISKPTVYQHIKSKGWLLETIFKTVLQRMKDDQESVIASNADPQEQLRECVRLYVHAATELQPYFNIFLGQEAELPTRTRMKFRAWAREMNDAFAGILASCASNGDARTDVDARIAGFLIVGMLTSIARWYDPKGPLTPDEVAEQVTAILEGYIIPRATQTARVVAS